MKHLNLCSLLVAAALLLGGISGCGGGASKKPTITVKPAEAEVVASDDSPSDDSDTDNAVPPDSSGYGTFKGYVTLTGAFSPLPSVVAMGKALKDKAVCAAEADIPNEQVVVNDGRLANVFIYLPRKPENGRQKAAHEPTSQLVFDQKGCQFFPHAMVMRTKVAILVKNSDPIDHNAKNRPKFNPEFNQTLGVSKPTTELTYKRAEKIPVSVECNLHNWMRAYQLPLDHPYGVVTKADGSFEIHDLPVGTHTFKVWHEAAGEIMEYEVTITKDGEVVDEPISVNASKLTAFRGVKSKTIKLTQNP
jgi:hypothetical protein